MRSSLIGVIEEQSEIIERQAEQIATLSKLLVNYMTVEEIEKMNSECQISGSDGVDEAGSGDVGTADEYIEENQYFY